MDSLSILDDMAKQKQAFAPVALPVDDTPSNEARARWEAEFRVQYEAEMRMKFMSSHTAGIAIANAAKTAIYAAHSAQLAIQNLNRDVRGISKEVRLKRLFKDMIIANVGEYLLNRAKSLGPKATASYFLESDIFKTKTIHISSPSLCDRSSNSNPNSFTKLEICEMIRSHDHRITGFSTFVEELDIMFDNKLSAFEILDMLKYRVRCQSDDLLSLNSRVFVEYLNEREKDIDPVIREELKQELKAEMKAERKQELKELKAEMKAERKQELKELKTEMKAEFNL